MSFPIIPCLLFLVSDSCHFSLCSSGHLFLCILFPIIFSSLYALPCYYLSPLAALFYLSALLYFRIVPVFSMPTPAITSCRLICKSLLFSYSQLHQWLLPFLSALVRSFQLVRNYFSSIYTISFSVFLLITVVTTSNIISFVPILSVIIVFSVCFLTILASRTINHYLPGHPLLLLSLHVSNYHIHCLPFSFFFFRFISNYIFARLVDW